MVIKPTLVLIIFSKSTLVLILFSQKNWFRTIAFFQINPRVDRIFQKWVSNHYIQKSTLVLILSSKIDFKPLYSKINPCVDLIISFKPLSSKNQPWHWSSFSKLGFQTVTFKNRPSWWSLVFDSLSKISPRADHSYCGWFSSQKWFLTCPSKWTFSFHFQDPICRQDQTNSFFLKSYKFSVNRVIFISFIHFIHIFYQVYINFIKFYQVLLNFIKFLSTFYPFRLRDKPDASFPWGIPLFYFPLRLRDKPDPCFLRCSHSE